MKFLLYTDKPIPQCMSALSDRFHGASKIDGYVDKTNKRFSMVMSTKILKRFERRTRLMGQLESGDGGTLIRGSVPSGVTRDRLYAVMAFMVLTVLLMIFVLRNAVGAVLIGLAGAYICVLLEGDALNGEALIREVKRILNAKDAPPKSERAAAGTRSPSALGAARTKGKSSRSR
jgi:hypothetical protein